MRGAGALAAWVAVAVLDSAATADAAPAEPSARLQVCLALSGRLALTDREARTAVAEAATIWRPLGIEIRRRGASDDGCNRLVVVKADHEALADEMTHDAALGWVPFVEGRARQLVFLRLDRARLLTGSLSPGHQPEGLVRLLFGKLVGRSLAHELGHVLLNSTRHEATGLMRARFQAADVLRDTASAYTLSAAERAQLFTQTSGHSRLAAR